MASEVDTWQVFYGLKTIIDGSLDLVEDSFIVASHPSIHPPTQCLSLHKAQGV